MSRNGSYNIKKWMDQDIRCAELFACICNVSKEDALEFSGISCHRFNTFLNMHLISKEFIDNIIYYRTTKEGRRVFENLTSIKGYASNSYYHDKKLYEIYRTLSDEERMTWRTESEQHEYCKNHSINLKDASVTDGAYLNDKKEWVYVEILTKHYTEAMRESKIKYVTKMRGTYKPYEI